MKPVNKIKVTGRSKKGFPTQDILHSVENISDKHFFKIENPNRFFSFNTHFFLNIP